ncbi:hypothetical protein H1R20_g11205, partial [Candolleomyces eurysporus]
MPPKLHKSNLRSRAVKWVSSHFKKSPNPGNEDPQDAAGIIDMGASMAPSISLSHHSVARPAPDLQLPEADLTDSCASATDHSSQIRIRHSRSENQISESSSITVPASVSSNDHLLPSSPSHPRNNKWLSPDDDPATGSEFASAHDEPPFQNVGHGNEGWELLLRHTSPNALHNSIHRFDAPKCDEDTRIEVIGEIMRWIEDHKSPQRLLCMTGAMASGKSALQQTIAEICGRKGTLASSYFFSALDPARNNVQAVVPIIAFQFGMAHPALKELIKVSVEADPFIFSKSLRAQMHALIVQPFTTLQRRGIELPYVMLIDGLDECRGEDHQGELLVAIEQCLLGNGLPLRIFITSRPELAIRSALGPGGHLHGMAYHIQLSEEYDATEDVRRYLRKRFLEIGLRIRDPRWFTEEDLETIVEATSGQFISATIVWRYLSERWAYPVDRLRMILSRTPQEGHSAQPFQALDPLYMQVLSFAKEAYEAIHGERDFLLLFRVHQVHSSSVTLPGFITSESSVTQAVDMVLGLEPRAIEALVTNLSSLVTLGEDDQGGQRLRLYHKSFSDFLDNEHRAKNLYIPADNVQAYIAKRCMHTIIRFPLELEYLPDRWAKIQVPEPYLKTLEVAIAFLPNSLRRARAVAVKNELVGFAHQGGWQRLDKLLPLLYDHAGYRLAYWVALLTEACAHLNFPGAFTHSESDSGFLQAQLFEYLLDRLLPLARYDCPKCDEDTRLEVATEIMNWIEDRNGPQRLLCMTGAAGAGKSALQQTIAECCGRLDILGSAFFLGAADPTRNTVTPIVPTIAFQLGLANPSLKQAITLAIENDPTIFSRSLQEQMDTLIVAPVRGLTVQGLDPKALPAYAILIDGLDECKGEHHQSELLAAIKKSLLASDLPFRIFIASRPEWAIRSALDPGGDLHELAYHIQLSDKYDATADIRRYLWRRLRDIGHKSRDPRVRSHLWPAAEDIEILVRAASGQFIYAATVVKYVSEPRVYPSDRLKTVITWTPAEDQLARPFENLDRLYANILSEAKGAYEAVDIYSRRDFLLLFRVYHMKDTRGLSGLNLRFNHTTALNAVLGLEEWAHESLISDLQSLVIYEPSQAHGFKLRSYHRSFSEFMENESRSQALFVPTSRVYAHIAKCSLQAINRCPLTSIPDSYVNLDELSNAPRTALISVFAFSICILDADSIDDEIVAFSRKRGWNRIDKLLSSLKPIRNRWVHEVVLPRLVDILSVLVDRIRDEAPELADLARYDSPKCDEDTHVEVISELMNWIEDRDSPQRLLFMTGAAGAGKSALQQTIAEICERKNIPAISFFFSAADSTRNTAKALIPTISYQLAKGCSELREGISNAVLEADPVIFSSSLQKQVTTLIANPLESLRGNSGINLSTLPYLILIDGVDECSGEERQAEVFPAVSTGLLHYNLPFRIFIDSRPEWAIRSALEPGGYLHKAAYHIQLSDEYDATADIRRYLWRRLRDIGVKSRDPRASSHLWPTEADIEILVQAASGQFIYAATIVKYVSERRSSPVDRLEVIVTWTSTPRKGQLARPFETLDILYASILTIAKEAYEAVDISNERDFVLLFRAYHVAAVTGIRCPNDVGSYILSSVLSLNRILSLGETAHETLVSDLHSLVRYRPDAARDFKLHVYHRSFTEFLEDESRSKHLFVSSSRVYGHIAKCSFRHIQEYRLKDALSTRFGNLSMLGVALLVSILGATEIEDELLDFTRKDGWRSLDALLSSDGCNPTVPLGWNRIFPKVVNHFKHRVPELTTVRLNATRILHEVPKARTRK